MTGANPVGALIRPLIPQVLGTLVRRHGQFDACEDAVQEALLAATVQWQAGGVPADPRGWLITVATRRLVDHFRSESARRRREEKLATLDPDPVVAPGEQLPGAAADDTLSLLFLCCHPAVSPPSQVALTLRAVGGLTTAEIARAFLVPEATMTRRITRAKESIAAAGARFTEPAPDDLAARLPVVLQVLYLVFNEGYAATSGENLQRAELTAEAVRLARAVHALRPGDGEVAGLLALMLLTEARRDARIGDRGELVPLPEQDRGRWDSALVAEGEALIDAVLGRTPLGPYQVQAAIAALHDRAPSAETTDWPQIVELYEVLRTFMPGPVVTLNQAVAVAQVAGPEHGLALLETVGAEHDVGRRADAVRAHLLELAGDRASAREHYLRAAERTSSLPERRYLMGRAGRLVPEDGARP